MYIFDEKVGRRKFIKDVSVAAAAVVGLSATTEGQAEGTDGKDSKILGVPTVLAHDAEGKKHWGRDAGEWIASCCNMCGGQSGILCHVVDGVLEKIEPNHWNPNNYGNISTDFMDGYTEAYGCKEGGQFVPKVMRGYATL